MFSRSTCWFYCIFVAVVIVSVYTETDSSTGSNTVGAVQESKGTASLNVEPSSKVSVTPDSATSAVDCSSRPPNATAVRRLRRLSEEDKNKRLILAAKTGAVQDVWTLIAAGADVTATDVLLCTPLHWAATKGHGEVVRCLLDAGARVDATDAYRETPLHDAAQNGHAAVIRQLLAANADVNATDFLGWTPLHNAARRGHLEAVRVLLAAGADKAARTDSYNTPLDVARLNDQHHNLTDILS